MSLGKYIKQVRLQRGLSQWELSKLSGLSRSHLSRLELDDYEHPSAETFLALAKGLKVNPNQLYQAAGYINKTRVWTATRKTPEEALAELEILTPVTVPLVTDMKSKEELDVVHYACLGLSRNGGINVVGVLANGFSLEPDIREGDIIFVDQEKTPSFGNIVLCYQDDEVRLMRYDLTSESNEDVGNDLHIYGVVVAINRNLA